MKKMCSLIVLLMAFTLSFYGCNSKQLSYKEKSEIWNVYEKECQKCHKASGRGSLIGRLFLKVPDFTSTKWQDNASDSRLIISIANGKGKMPAYKGKLKDEEIVDLVKTCVRSFYPPAEQ